VFIRVSTYGFPLVSVRKLAQRSNGHIKNATQAENFICEPSEKYLSDMPIMTNWGLQIQNRLGQPRNSMFAFNFLRVDIYMVRLFAKINKIRWCKNDVNLYYLINNESSRPKLQYYKKHEVARCVCIKSPFKFNKWDLKPVHKFIRLQ
jgi:hypothetical protein